MPFGEPRGTQPTWLGTKGYVGGTKDDTGLTHLGAREYDPTIGRFISVDPRVDPLVPQSLHAYLYANNSPATFSDPTGYDWWKAAIQGAVAAVVDATHGTANAIYDRYEGLARLPVEEARQTNAGEQSFWEGADDIVREWINPNGVEAIVEDFKYRVGSVLAGEGDEAYYNMTYVPVSILGVPAGVKGVGAAVRMSGSYRPTFVAAGDVRFSQKSVNGSGEIEASMRASGWQGDAIDVVRMPDGRLTTIDNTRLLAAQRAGIKVKVRIHEYNDPIDKTNAGRFKGQPTTWGEAVTSRIGSQGAAFRNNNPYGSTNRPLDKTLRFLEGLE